MKEWDEAEALVLAWTSDYLESHEPLRVACEVALDRVQPARAESWIRRLRELGAPEDLVEGLMAGVRSQDARD